MGRLVVGSGSAFSRASLGLGVAILLAYPLPARAAPPLVLPDAGRAVKAAAPQSAKLAVTALGSVASQTDSIGLGRTGHRDVIMQALQRAGYSVAEAGHEPEADFALGGSVKEIFCEADSLVHCSVAVRWEVTDARTRRVLYRVTVRARKSGMNSEQLIPLLVNAAVDSLAARPKFKALTRDLDHTLASAEVGFRECARPTLAMPKAATTVLAATVLIESGDRLGSGSIISPDGFILTAAHVLEPGVRPALQLSTGQTLAADVIRVDLTDDVALLHTSGNFGSSCLPMRQGPINVGEEVYAIGSPLTKQLSFSLTRGIVSGFRTMDGVPLLQTDASVNPGNSGGPLVDQEGHLLGVVDFKLMGQVVQGLAFAVTASAALGALQLQPATTSDPVLYQPRSVPTRSADQAIEDTEDPVLVGDRPVANGYSSYSGGSTAASSLRAGGALAITLGLTAVGSTWLGYELAKTGGGMTHSTFKTYQTLNTISWAVVGLGVGSMVVSYLLPSTHSSIGRGQGRRWYLGVSPGNIAVGGEL